MKVRSSTRATSLGSEAQWKELGFWSSLRRVKVPAATSLSVSCVHSCVGAGDPADAVGGGQGGNLGHPGGEPSVGRAAVGGDVGPGRGVGGVCCRRHRSAIPFAAPSWRPTSVALCAQRPPVERVSTC